MRHGIPYGCLTKQTSIAYQIRDTTHSILLEHYNDFWHSIAPNDPKFHTYKEFAMGNLDTKFETSIANSY